MEIKGTCPFGHTCEKAVDNVIERCNLYTRIVGMNPQTGVQEDQWKCAIAWQPILLIENSKQTRSVAAAVEDHRNQSVAVQRSAIGVLRNVRNIET